MELDRRNIHRNPEWIRPCGRFLARLAQNPFAERDDLRALFCNRDEGLGRDPAAFRAVPSRECLESDDFVEGDGLLRLVMQKQVATVGRTAQVCLQFATLAQTRAEL